MRKTILQLLHGWLSFALKFVAKTQNLLVVDKQSECFSVPSFSVFVRLGKDGMSVYSVRLIPAI